jgi:hypothetical protein
LVAAIQFPWKISWATIFFDGRTGDLTGWMILEQRQTAIPEEQRHSRHVERPTTDSSRYTVADHSESARPFVAAHCRVGQKSSGYRGGTLDTRCPGVIPGCSATRRQEIWINPGANADAWAGVSAAFARSDSAPNKVASPNAAILAFISDAVRRQRSTVVPVEHLRDT